MVIFLSVVCFMFVAEGRVAGHHSPMRCSNSLLFVKWGCGMEMGSKVTADFWVLNVRLAQGFFQGM